MKSNIVTFTITKIVKNPTKHKPNGEANTTNSAQQKVAHGKLLPNDIIN